MGMARDEVEGGIRMICESCGRNLDAIGQDNVSYTPGVVICEDCAGVNKEIGSCNDVGMRAQPAKEE